MDNILVSMLPIKTQSLLLDDKPYNCVVHIKIFKSNMHVSYENTEKKHGYNKFDRGHVIKFDEALSKKVLFG